jgi:dipeptidyl-peptidase 4
LTVAVRRDEDAPMVAAPVRHSAFAVVLAVAAVIAAAGCRDRDRDRDRSAGAPGGSGMPGAPPADEKIAWPAIDEQALIALQSTERFELGSPTPLAIAPDGAVLFRRSKPRDRVADLYQLDATGKTTQLASAATLLASKPGAADAAKIDAGAGIETIQLSDDGARILVSLAGRAFVIERASGASRELAIAPFRDPQLSPDGKRVAFVRAGDLWVATIGEPNATRLAQHPPDEPGSPGAREYATPDGAARAFGRDRGFWWSPDSQAIAFERSDARAVEPMYLADPRHPEQPPTATRAARSGKPIATVDVGIVSVRGGAPRWVTWELPRYPYLARVVWPAKGPLTLIVVGREQTIAAVLAVDPASGATRPLLLEKDAAWVNLPPDGFAWLPDGSGFLWMTQSSGAWSLERHTADGAHAGTVTTADFGVRRIAGIAPDGGEVIVEGAADPREQHVWRIALAGGAPKPLTTGGGVHSARVAHGVIALGSQLRGGGRDATVLRADGSRTPLPSVAERPAKPPTTKLESINFEDHAQYTAVTRPHAFDPKLRYPVVLRIGAAPDASSVLDALDTYLLDQWYADAGFIVVRSDGRGPLYSDRSWNHAIAGDLLTVPMNDQIGALKRLGGRYPELDRSRVGALGGEFGGFLSTMAAMLHPDAFAAAVAVSPITDWELVDAATAERFLKTPATNAEGYRRNQAAAYAEQLTRPLLLFPSVPGSRIATAHAFQLIDALSAAGKHAEIATLPDRPDAAHRIAATRLVMEFLRQQLGAPVRPAVMPAPRGEEDDEEEEERERAQRAGGSAAGSGSAPRDDKDHR